MSAMHQWLRSLEPRTMAWLSGPLGEKIRPWVDSHDVLNFGRHSLAKGVAFGFLCGLLPLGPIQVGSTIACCVRFRGNALIGALTTLYSNAFTIVPLYILAFQIGQWFVPGTHTMPDWQQLTSEQGWLSGFWQGVTTMGWPLLVGIPILSLGLAILGYVLVHAVWLFPVFQRARRMKAAKHLRQS